MSSVENPYQAPPFSFAAQAAAGERADFIAKTYGHLAGAIVAFVALEAVLLNLPGVESLVGLMIGTRYGWLAVLGLFMVVSWIADGWARSAISTSTQYMGLGLYVLAEAIIFVPLLYIARAMDPMLIPTAGVATLVLFGVLTAVVFATRADFSFLRSVLIFGGFAALALIVVAILFGFAPGPDLHGRDDRPGLWVHPLRHVERPAPLPDRPARRRRAGAVCRGRPAVLVHPPAVHGVAALRTRWAS